MANDFVNVPENVQLFDSVIARKKAELAEASAVKKSFQPNLYADAEKIGRPSQDLVNFVPDPFALPQEIKNQKEEDYKTVYAHTMGEDAQQLFGGFVTGAAMVGDIPLSVPNLLADGVSALAKMGLSDDVYETASKNLSGFKQTLEIMDLMGDKVVEKTRNFYGQDNVNTMSAQARSEWRKADGFFDTVGAIVNTVADNPTATPQIILESLPIIRLLASKGVGFASAYLHLVSDSVKESQQIYARKNGREAEGADYFHMVAAAAASAGIETLEARFLLGKFKPSSNGVIKAINNIPLARPAVGTLAGGVAEFGQEGSASLLAAYGGEQTLNAFTNAEYIENAFVAGTLGFGAGAGIKGATSIPETVGDVGRIASGTKKIAKDGLGAVGALNVDRRIANAEKAGDKVKLIKASLEKDLSSFDTQEERKAFYNNLVQTFQSIPEGEISKEDTQQLYTSLLAVGKENKRLERAETGKQSLEAAETAIQQAKKGQKDLKESIATIVETIEEGGDVKPTTVARIFGSDIVNTLKPEEKETLDLYSEFQAVERDVSQRTLELVASDIATGNAADKFLGLTDHRRRLREAITQKDPEKAVLTLKRLKKLRGRLMEKLASPSTQQDKRIGVDTHAPVFVSQLTREIDAITKAMRLLDRNFKTNFKETSPLTEGDLKLPDIAVYGEETRFGKKRERSKKGPSTKEETSQTKTKSKAKTEPTVDERNPPPPTDEDVSPNTNEEEDTDAESPAPVTPEPEVEVKQETDEKKVRQLMTERILLLRSLDRREGNKMMARYLIIMEETKEGAERIAALEKLIEATEQKISEISNKKEKPSKTESNKQGEFVLEGENTLHEISDRRKLVLQLVNTKEELASIERVIDATLKQSTTVLRAIAKAGGLNRESFLSQGVDKEYFKLKKGLPVGKPLFPKEGGMDPDMLGEFLWENGYQGMNSNNTDDRPEVSELMDMFFEVLGSPETILDPNEVEALNALENDKTQVEGQIDYLERQIDKLPAETLREELGLQGSEEVFSEIEPEDEIDVDGFIDFTVEGFQEFVDFNIPTKRDYNKFFRDQDIQNPLNRKIETSSRRKLDSTYMQKILEQDSILRLVQNMVSGKCNG